MILHSEIHSFRDVFDLILILFAVLLTREEEFSDRLSNRANFQNCTPLHYAVLVNDLESIRLLLEAGMVK